MSEQFEKLRATITDLELELSQLDSFDADTRRLLEDAMAEIQAAIHKQDATHLQPHFLSGRLASAAERFETTHPTLFGIVSRIVEGLAQMGI